MPVFKEKTLDSIVSSTKGTDIYNAMLLEQYTASTNLKAYAGAFLAEFDTLYEEAERMYLGRFLEYATGDQLTVLGNIVGVTRELTLDESYFGFFAEIGGIEEILSDTFGTISDPEVGGKFRSITENIVQLSDSTFRRAVRAKAFCNGAATQDVEFMYKVIAMLIGKIPSTFILEEDSGTTDKRIILTLETDKVGVEALNLVKAMQPFFMPAGYQFVFSLL